MKLATLKEGKRDGTLVVVNKEMTRAVKVDHIARTMQEALDSWKEVAPQLEKIYQTICSGDVDGSFEFDPCAMMAPLPRAYQWADGSA